MEVDAQVMKPPRSFFASLLALLLIAVVGLTALAIYRSRGGYRARIPWVSSIIPSRPARLARPYGMAPAAFEAYIRACVRAGVNPNRIGQTIGDDPRSKGYHKRDGVLWVGGQRVDYCTAVDLGTFDLTEAQIERLLHELTVQGFACWYRHEGKWKGGEHIHAVYCFLPMKRQLRRQVRQFLRERREAGLHSLKWEKELRRRLRVSTA
ncbi:MAG TPA: hypothetical protein VNA16_09825 [Abditibacteriaceae bacterium]|nr:hypothetical protein [Abditibacteriaceae bacterium]